MGLEEAGIGKKDTLAALGMDSLQMVEIRAKVQHAIGRPVPLEKVVHQTTRHKQLEKSTVPLMRAALNDSLFWALNKQRQLICADKALPI